MLIDINDEHPENAYDPIDITLGGISIDFNAEHPRNEE